MGSGARLRVGLVHMQQCGSRRVLGCAAVGSGARLRVRLGHVQQCGRRRTFGGVAVVERTAASGTQAISISSNNTCSTWGDGWGVCSDPPSRGTQTRYFHTCPTQLNNLSTLATEIRQCTNPCGQMSSVGDYLYQLCGSHHCTQVYCLLQIRLIYVYYLSKILCRKVLCRFVSSSVPSLS
eukprot:SAG31_NODE_10338_length_1152_cov_4.116809_2_plen_180_part_00